MHLIFVPTYPFCHSSFLASKASRMTFWRGEVNTSTTDKMRTATSTLPLIDQLFAVLVRLKVGLFVQDISDRFQISPASFSMYFTTWISLLHAELISQPRHYSENNARFIQSQISFNKSSSKPKIAWRRDDRQQYM